MQLLHSWSSSGPSSSWLIALTPLLFLLVSGSSLEDFQSDASECFGHSSNACDRGDVQSVAGASLLQLNRQWAAGAASAAGSEDYTVRQRLSAAASAATSLAEDSQTQIEAAGSSSGGQFAKYMQSAVNNAKSAELTAVTDATNAVQTAQSVENVHHESQEALAAQEFQAKTSAEVGEALKGAMQRVQRAGEVESQELQMEAMATKRLQDAARGAREVQALEDEGAAREARAAELLQEAIQKLDSPDQEDTSSPFRETLKVVQQAQMAAAADSAGKARASQLLQTSLEGAATAVEALKRGKEAQTSTYLRDAYRNLEWMDASWTERTKAEAKVTHELKAAVKSADSAKELIDDTSNNKQSAVTLLQDVVKDVRSAQDVVFQESAANRAETQKEAFMRMQGALQQGQMQLGQPQLNAAYQMQQMQNAKAMSEAQQQMQLAQMMQQFPQVPPAQNSYMQSLPEAFNMYQANGAFQHGQPRFP